METANLESVLEVLGCDPLPDANTTNLYSGFGAPVAKLFAKDDGFKLRFGSDVRPVSTVDFLPSGGIRVKPALLPRAQRSE